MKEIKNIDKLFNAYEHTIENNGGNFTRDGELVNLTDGYMVGVSGLVSGLDAVSFSVLFDRVAEYENDYLEYESFVGTWKHENQIYIDLSIRVPSVSDALKMAQELGQIAIYDIAENESIYI